MVGRAELAPVKVCILSSQESLHESLDLESIGSGYKIEQSFSEAQNLVDFFASSSSDHVVVIDLRDQCEQRLSLIKELSASRPLAIVAVASAKADCGLGKSAIEVGAQALLVDPVRAPDVRVAFTVAIYQQAKQERLETEICLLREKLAERKLIEKAKGILMDSAKVSEAEAFRLMQKESQDKRKPMIEIAELIISAADLVKAARSQVD